MRLSYPSNVKVIQVPCTGRVDIIHLLKAIEDGADAVYVAGCMEGECLFLGGNLKAKKRVQYVKKVLQELGIEPERVEMFNLPTIHRVRYTRGLDEPADSTAGCQGLRVSEWSAPVPSSILEAFERERIEELEGHWGDERVGRPVQLDRIEVETDTDLLTIEVANRAICLVASDDEALRRIHRVCGALEHAEGGEAATVTTVTESRRARIQLVAPAESVDVNARTEEAAAGRREEDELAALLKEHRRLGGSCALCGAAVTRRTVTRHLDRCAHRR